ncbi:MAG: hypothetical protein ABSD48_05420 [Armatimonadota bacterium]
MGTQTRTTGLLLLAVCLLPLSLAYAAPAVGELAPPTVAVQNDAGAAGEALVAVVTDGLTARAQAMPELRASLGQPWALDAKIAGASAAGGKAQVKLTAELAPPVGHIRYMAEAEGEGTSGADAAGKASADVMHELGLLVKAKGTVYHYGDKELEAWITIGQDQGIRVRARVAFLVDGEVVGEGTVIQTKDMDSIVRVDKGVPAGNVTRGVDARVIKNGPRWAVREEMAQESRHRGVGAFLALAVIGGLIAAAR